MKRWIILVILVIFLAIAFQVGAAIEFGNPATGDMEDIISAIADFIFITGIIVCPIIILFGAFSFMSAGGDPAKVQKAKKLVVYALIGLFIILLGKNIGPIINTLLGLR